MRPERYDVTLCVEHDAVSSAELTNALGVSPDKAWDVGTEFLLGRHIKHHKYSRWSIVEHVDPMEDMREAVDRLMKRVAAFESRLASLPQGSSVSLEMALTTRDTVLGISLSEEQVRMLSALGASIDISIAIWASPSTDQ
jgi:hypothetical protein